MKREPLKLTIRDVIRDPMRGDVVCLKDGTAIYITGGCWLDPTYHRLSNHWNWRVINGDGSLGKPDQGYGDFFKPVEKVAIEINVRVIRVKS